MSVKHDLPTPGAFFEARYPFKRVEVDIFDADGPSTIKSWAPGTYYETRIIRRYDEIDEEVDMVADGEGTIILTVVSVHKPGRFPTRVFFTRRWRDPRGHEFGKSKLHIATVAKFYELTRGYRHKYEMAKTPAEELPPPKPKAIAADVCAADDLPF